MVMLLQRQAKVAGYNVEADWGTDPGGTRLAILGVAKVTLTINQNRGPYQGTGAGFDPQGYKWGEQEITIETEDKVQDDNKNNSLIAMALGSAPDGTTGIITNYPTASYGNIRSATWELGFDWDGTDIYFVVVGCRIKKFELEYGDHELIRRITWVCKSYTHSATATGTLPSLSTLEWFDPQEDGTYTWANPTISGVMLEKMKVTIENITKEKGVLGGGRGKGYIQVTGRKVLIDFAPWVTGWDFFNLVEGAPNAAAGNFDLTAVLSKNTTAEYISLAMTNCEIISPYKIDLNDSDDLVGQNLQAQVKTLVARVVTP